MKVMNFDMKLRFPNGDNVIQTKADELAAIIRGNKPSPDELESCLSGLYEAIYDTIEPEA